MSAYERPQSASAWLCDADAVDLADACSGYTADMGVRCHTLLGTLLATAALHAAPGNLAIGGGVGAYYGVPLARGIYDPWFSCSPYWCRDPVQLRLELERHRRMQELRERATQPEPRIYGPVYGTSGLHRYVPPVTSEANIQPAYRGASQLRPEYEHSSQLRPEYEQSAQPSGEPAPESLK
jgi:hypothetical protein